MQSTSINYIIQNLKSINNDNVINDFKNYLASNEETITKLFPLFIVMLMRAAEKNISVEDNNKIISSNISTNNDTLNSERNLKEFREKRVFEQINEKLNSIFKSTSNLVKSSETGLTLLNQLLITVKERNENRRNSLGLFDNFLSGRTGKLLLSILGPLMAGASVALIASYLLSDINEENSNENEEKSKEENEETSRNEVNNSETTNRNIQETITNNKEAIENIIQNNENSNNAIARLMILGQSLGLSGNALNEFVKESMNMHAEHYGVENSLVNNSQNEEPQNEIQNEQPQTIIENKPLATLPRTINNNNMYLQQNDEYNEYNALNLEQNKETNTNDSKITIERVPQTSSSMNYNALLENTNSFDKENDNKDNELFTKRLSNYTDRENNIVNMGIEKINAKSDYVLPLNVLNDSLENKDIKLEIEEQIKDQEDIVKLTKKGLYENEDITISARKINFKFDDIDFIDMLMRDSLGIDYDISNFLMAPTSFGRTIRQAQRVRSYENNGDAGIEPNENDLERQYGTDEIHPSLQVPGLQSDIQKIGTEILEDFPQAIVTSTYRPYDIGSQHSLGRAIDISLRQLSQDQRAQLVKNLTTEKYGRIGGIGTYNASGDLLHIDTRPSQKLAWGPNRSITSLNQTPSWFQEAVTQWMGNNTLRAQAQQSTTSGSIQKTSIQATTNTGTALQTNTQATLSNLLTATQENIVAENTREPPTITNIGGSNGNNIIPGTSPPNYLNNPNDPGNVEPENADEIYSLLFGI
jgi:hypothetical protein